MLPLARFKGEANVLIMPNLDAANIAYHMIKVLADGLPVGPILIGAAARPTPHAVGDGARRRQHDGGGGGGAQAAASSESRAGNSPRRPDRQLS